MSEQPAKHGLTAGSEEQNEGSWGYHLVGEYQKRLDKANYEHDGELVVFMRETSEF